GATALHCTYFGGNVADSGLDIAFTSTGLMLVAGGTNSSIFPNTSLGNLYYATNPQNLGYYLQNNFVAAFQKGNTNIIWCSNLGSNADESFISSPAFDHIYSM